MSRRTPYFFLLPAIVFLAWFMVVPALQIFYYSFLNYSVFSASTFVGMENYRRLFADVNFWWTLLNSFLFILVTPVLMFLSLVLALCVRNLQRGTKLFRTFYFLPVITPIVIAGIIWRWIFAEDTGIANYFLSLLSIPNVHWLTEYPTTIISIMLVTIWRGAGYYMMIFLAGLALIPKEVEEASLIDGATIFQQTFHILIPLLKPTLIFIFVISSTAAIKIFTEIYIMIPGAPMANKALVSFLYQQAFERFDLGYGSAVGVVLFLITLSFSYVNIKLIEQRG